MQKGLGGEAAGSAFNLYNNQKPLAMFFSNPNLINTLSSQVCDHHITVHSNPYMALSTSFRT